MKAYISTCVAGVFAFDENKKLLSYKFFDKDPESISEKIASFEDGKSFPEMKEVIRRLNEKGISEIVTKTEKNIAVRHLRNNFRRFAIELKFAKNEQDLNALISDVAVFQTKNKI